MIKYDPLWRTLKEKGISQYQLIKDYGIDKAQLQLEFPYFYPHSPAFTGSAINNFQKMPKHKESYSFLM